MIIHICIMLPVHMEYFLYIKERERDTMMLDLLDHIFDPVMPRIKKTLQATRHGGIAKVVAQVVKWHSGP